MCALGGLETKKARKSLSSGLRASRRESAGQQDRMTRIGYMRIGLYRPQVRPRAVTSEERPIIGAQIDILNIAREGNWGSYS